MIYEQRTLGADRVDTVRITLETTPELIEQYAQDGYTEVMEHYLVLYKPPEAIILQDKLDTIATALPDDIAAEYPDLYPVWMEGMTLEANDRIQHDGGLYRVQQAHTTEHPPSVNTAALYTRINAPGEILHFHPERRGADGLHERHFEGLRDARPAVVRP